MEEFNKRELTHQRNIIDAVIAGKNIQYRRIKPLNPDLLESYEWRDTKLHLTPPHFNFQHFEYRIEPDKKVKMWQWILFDKKNYFLSGFFFSNAEAAKNAIGHSAMIVGPAPWTETEFDI